MLPNKRVFTAPNKRPVAVEFKQPSATVNSIESMIEFCKQGLGLATPPDFLLEQSLQRGELVEVLPRWQVSAIAYYAVWPDNVGVNSNALWLLRHLTQGLSNDAEPTTKTAD